MPGPVKLIDSAVKDELLRFPTLELIRRLFPEVRLRGRSVVCNPLRNDKHPSLSFFRDWAGFQRWKDFATGETGDNIDFFRKVYPDLGYVEAVDRLSLLVLGKSALQDFVPGKSVPVYSQARRQRPVRMESKPEEPVLKIVSSLPYRVGSISEEIVAYTRQRGISDEVASSFLHYVVYENSNIKGRPVMDQDSGLPVLDANGTVIEQISRYEAVAMRNDIGGFSLRVPPGEKTDGFKGSNRSFISTFLAGGKPFGPEVRFTGRGDGFVTGFSYDEGHRFLAVNAFQGFVGVEPWAVRPAVVFLDTWIGRYLESRDVDGAQAVIRSLNSPVSGEVDVVEGLFDAVSVVEFEMMSGHGPVLGRDLVVLNSISNLNWAVPFLAVHGNVHSLLDNDMRSSAGQKAFDVLKERIEVFSARLGCCCVVKSDSRIFYPCKDINDFLVKRKAEIPKVVPEEVKKKTPSKPRRNRKPIREKSIRLVKP